MENRISLQRKGSKADSIFTYGGLIISLSYLCIIGAIIITLLYGAWPSIKKFSFRFLFSQEWGVRSVIALEPQVHVENGTILLRFSAGITDKDISKSITLLHDDKEKAFTSIVSENKKSILLQQPLPHGEYRLRIQRSLENKRNAPLLYSYMYNFTVKEGEVLHSEWKSLGEPISMKDSLLYGALPFLFGTVVTSLLSLCFSVPFAIAIAIYLNEYEKKTKKGYILSSITDLLAGIPSVIYGFWGMFFLAPYFGSNIFTASLVLAIMSLPYSTAMTRESIALVSNSLRYAGYAMGATRYSVLFHIVIPYAKSGIIAGVILALGRALGETLAVTMVIGNSNRMPFSIFEPAQTIASLIANEYAEASGMKQSALIELGFLLICVTAFFALLGRFLVRGRRKI